MQCFHVDNKKWLNHTGICLLVNCLTQFYLLEHGDLILVQLPDVLPGEVADPEEHLRPKDRTNKPDAVSVTHTHM